ncbi:MAG TPA: helix-turn-helix domain-containing protein [Herpetosiphonaceae bacterium]|nr:helix-turn-helix domain-containing protein [Herpetosiphonaceae bacterium]
MSDRDRNIIIEDPTLAAGFTQIPNVVLRRLGLSPGAKLTYVMLLSYAWQDGACFPGQETLARDMGFTDRSVRTYLKELQEHGLITIRQRGLNLTNLYILNRLGPEVDSALRLGPEIISGPDRNQTTPLERKPLPTTNTQATKTQNDHFESSRGLSLVEKYDDARAAILPYAEDFGRELGDQAPLASTTTRLTNLYRSSGLALDDFLDLLVTARHITQERSASIRTRSEGLAPKPKMPYMLTVLEDLIGQTQAAMGTGND